MKKFYLSVALLAICSNQSFAYEVVRGNKTLLMQAAETGDMGMIKSLLATKSSREIHRIDYSGNNAYCYAYVNNHIDVATALESYGMNTDMNCYVDGLSFKSESLTGNQVIASTNDYKFTDTPKKHVDISYKVKPINPTTVTTVSSGISPAIYAGLSTLALGGVAAAAGGGGGGSDSSSSTPTDDTDSPSYNGTSDYLGIHKAQAAYDRGYTGSGVTVAVLDSGINQLHLGFTGQINGDLSNTNIQGIIENNEKVQEYIDANGARPTTAGSEQDGWDAGYAAIEFETDIDNPYNKYEDSLHGTAVAGIIAGREGWGETHGVAYDATILPYRMGVTGEGSQGTIYTAGATGMAITDAANKGAFVVNMSFGQDIDISDWNAGKAVNWSQTGTSAGQNLTFDYTGYFYDSVTSDNLSDYASMQTLYNTISNANGGEGMLLVKAAGNDGYTQSGFDSSLPLIFSEFEDYFVNVVALDATGEALADYSNAAGVAMNYTIAAAGTDVATAFSNFGWGDTFVTEEENQNGEQNPLIAFRDQSGTSFATPVVSAAAAIIKSAFPYMDAPQVANVMFSTADDLGEAGVDEVYGNGRLNLDAATTPGGGGSVVTSVGTSVPFKGTSVTTSSAFGNIELSSMAMTDTSYGLDRTFEYSGSSMLTDAEDSFDMIDNAKSFGQTKKTIVNKINGFGTSFTMNNEEDSNASDFANIEKMSFSSEYGKDTSINFAFTTEPGADTVNTTNSSYLLRNDVNNHPFMNLASTGFSTGIDHKLSDNLSVENSSFFGNVENDENEDLGSMFVSSTKFKYDNKEGTALSLELGISNETDTVLGSSFDGALSLAGNNSTYFTGIGADVDLSNNLRAFANGYIGYTTTGTTSNSLVSDVDNITSHSLSLGAEYSFDASEKAGLVLSQPLKVASGSMNYSTATSRNDDGSYNYGNFSQDLSTGGTEYNVQAYYAHDLYKDTSMNIGAIHRFNANNVEGDNETAVMFKLKHSY